MNTSDIRANYHSDGPTQTKIRRLPTDAWDPQLIWEKSLERWKRWIF